MNVTKLTFTTAYSALDHYAEALLAYYDAAEVAKGKYTGIYLDTTLAEAKKPLKDAAGRAGIIIGNALDEIISEVTDTGKLPESVYAAGVAMGKPLSATVCDSICKSYLGDMTALRFLLDVAADENKAMITSYLLDADELQTAKKDILHIVDAPDVLSIRMHNVRQTMRKAAEALGLSIADPESEAYTEARFQAMCNHAGVRNYY